MAQAICTALITKLGLNVEDQPAAAAQVAQLCDAIAEGVVGYIQANGTATVSVGNLQKLPASITPGAATVAPDSPVSLPIA